MLWYKQAGMIEDEMLSRNPKAQVIAEKLRSMGMSEIGSRYGKAGVQYGVEGKARRISLGARDLLLNYFLAQGRDTRWNMYKSFSIKKVYDDPTRDAFLQKLADWVSRAPTMIEVRQRQRDRSVSDPYAAATGLEKATDSIPQPQPQVQPEPKRCECGASIPHLARECPDCGKSVD